MSGWDEISIREIRLSDFERLKGFLERNNTPETIRHFHPFPLTAETARWITTVPRRDRYYLALCRKQVIGLCMLRGWDEGFAVPSFGIVVGREFHSKGIGRIITEYAMKEAKKLCCKQVRLSVYASNISAYNTYISMGFKETNREVVEINGEKDEKIIMDKDLGY